MFTALQSGSGWSEAGANWIRWPRAGDDLQGPHRERCSCPRAHGWFWAFGVFGNHSARERCLLMSGKIHYVTKEAHSTSQLKVLVSAMGYSLHFVLRPLIFLG